jgi:dihydroneopterin aldolase
MADDLIQIRELRVSTRLGVPDAERSAAQTVSVSVEMEPKVAFAELGDELGQTVDYHAVALRISEVAAAGERRLAETLAVEIAEMLLGEFAVKSVEVGVEKEVLFQAAGVGVKVRRP